MTASCARCDWSSTEEPIAGHAAEAGHPLCAVCNRSLRPDEPAVCVHCEGRVARALVYLRRSWAALEVVDASPAGQQPGAGAGRSSGVTVPGGLGAVLRGRGRSWRWAAPRLTPPPGVPQRNVMGHLDDERADDGPSLVAELTYWCCDWAARLGTPLPWRPEGSPVVRPLLQYLGDRVPWAASVDARFGEFAADVAELERWARRSLGEIEGPLTDTVACIDCSTPDHVVWLVIEEDPRGRGWSDDPVCPHCRRVYTDDERQLALAELLRRKAAA